MPTLVSISYSPWSIRARLALSVMGVAVHKVPYTPTVSEPWLRAQLRQPFGRVTVPVLLREGEPPLTDSFAIVQWGAARSDRPLVTTATADAIDGWNERASRLLEAGRVRTTRRIRGDAVALRESLPPQVRALGPLAVIAGRVATRRLLRKYPFGDHADDALLDRMRASLEDLQRALSTRRYLVGDTLTYADLTMAVGLSFVRPHATHPLPDLARAYWEEPALCADLPEVLAWRDRVMDEVAAARLT